MNTTTSVISMLSIVIVLLSGCAVEATAQIEGVWNHDTLVWNRLGVAPHVTPAGREADSALTRFFVHDSVLLFGWNFGAVDREIAEHLDMRVDHTTDEYINSIRQLGNDNERKHQLPRKILIPRIIGLGTNTDRNMYRSPNESVAMEFQPWLVWNAATGRMNFVRDDPTGGVFGFRSVSPLATVAGTGINYRSLALTAAMTQPGVRTLVCDNIWPSDAIRRYNAGDNNSGSYNTDTLILSITLTVTNAPGAQPDDEILRIRIPYWRGSQCTDFTPNNAQGANNGPTDYIRFQRVPDPNEPWTQELDPFNANIIVGQRKGPGINLANNPPGFTDELIITRAMLPPLGTEGTIEARFVCNWTMEQARVNAHQNPLFFLNDQNSAADNNAHNTQISHIDIDVEYSGLVDLELRNVRIETPAARDLFWRTLDAAIVGSPNTNRGFDVATGNLPGAIRDYLAALRQRNEALFGTQPADEIDYARVWRFYGKDEIIPCYWKSYRYLNRLLGGRLITEWGVWWPEAAEYSLHMDNFWQGNTFQPDPSVATYTIADGFSRHTSVPEAEQRPYLGLARGRNDFGRDPDLQVEGHSYTLPDSLSRPLPIHPDTVDMRMTFDASGIQPRVEFVMHDRYWANRYMLYGADTIRWLANVWNYSSLRFNGTTTQHWLLFASNGRPKSCAEYRLQLWSPLILGAKGLIVYRGENAVLPAAGADLDPLRPIPGPTTTAVVNGVLEPCLFAGNIPFAQPDLRATPPDELIDNNVDAQCGDDWITANDATNADDWMSEPIENIAATLEQVPLGTAAPQVYIGQRTMRQVTREVALRLDAGMRATFAHLRLKGWHARSYRRYTSWENDATDPDGSPFTGRIDISDGASSRLSTRPVGRNRPTPGMLPGELDPGTASWEPVDSTFLDLTILSHVDDPTMNDSFYVGVLNRRTNPLMTTGTETVPQFHPYGDLLTEWATHPERFYAQLGAREVRIPFRYTLHSGKVLRITEQGAADTIAGYANRPLERPPLDTIIGADRDFVTRFLPGEGRIYKVRIIDATETTDSRGWLAHPGQRKIVFAPNFNAMSAITETDTQIRAPGDTCTVARTYQRPAFETARRYHIVYHRRSGEQQDGPLSVYYRRSTAIDADGSPSVDTAVNSGNINWEPEILLSDRVVVRQTPTDGAAVLDVWNPSCGYPSLVVRFDAMTNMNKVYVVYACEQGDPSNPQGRPIAICEAVLEADAPAAVQRQSYENIYRSEIMDYVTVGACGATDRLRYWGTPTINASAGVNYYAWSDNALGIRMGVKSPERRFFVANQQASRRLQSGAVARFPSLNTYSRLHLGEPDAAIVWQEGWANEPCDNGIWIAYTRLFHEMVNNVPQLRVSMVPQDMTALGLGADPQMYYWPQVDALSINIETAGDRNNQYPSIYRHLSDYGGVSAPSPWRYIGEMHHKAERVVWQTTPNTPIAGVRSSIERRVFDLYDSILCEPRRVDLWSLPQSRIFSLTHDLTAPSIAQGSQDRELYSSTSPARDWDYDDTTMTLAFSEGANTEAPAMWLSAYGWDLYGQNTDWELTPSHIGMVSHTIKLVHSGQRPHLAARYSMSQDRSTQKNRLIYELGPGANNAPGVYTNAPDITRTNEGLYRQAFAKGDATEQTQRSSIEYAGFRSDRAEVFVSSIRLGEKDLYFRTEEDYTTKKNTDQRLVTPWVSIADMEDAALSVVTTGELDRFDVDIERQSDGTRLPLNVLATNLGRAPRRQAWKLGADPTEHYRFVIESRDRRAAPTVDIELVENTAPLLRSTENAITVLDLRAMRAVTATNDLRVFPQPATDKLTVVMPADSGAARARRMQLSTLIGEVIMEYQVGAAPVVDIDVSAIPTGTYVLTLVESKTTMRTIVRIAR